MIRTPFLYAAGLTAAAVMAAGVLWFALHRSPNQTVQAAPVTIQQLQQLAQPAVAVTSAPAFIDVLRSVKAFLVRNPSIKTAYTPAAFSWRRDLFDQLTNLFNTVLLQKPDQAQLAKMLSLVDAIADEFEADNAGKQYNAEVDVAAQGWRNAMYDAVKQYTEQPTNLANTQHKLQPLAAGATPTNSRRGAADLTQKVLLKDKKLPMAHATLPAPVTTEQAPAYQAPAEQYAPQQSQSYNYDDFADDNDYDYFESAAPGYADPSYNASPSAGSSSTSAHTNRPRNAKKMTTQEQQATQAAADNKDGTKKSPGLGAGTSEPAPEMSMQDQVFAQQAQQREAEKKGIVELQEFMKDFQKFHEEKQKETLRDIAAMGII